MGCLDEKRTLTSDYIINQTYERAVVNSSHNIIRECSIIIYARCAGMTRKSIDLWVCVRKSMDTYARPKRVF